MANKYPQKKKCPVCGNVMSYCDGRYYCVKNNCVSNPNTVLKPAKSKSTGKGKP